MYFINTTTIRVQDIIQDLSLVSVDYEYREVTDDVSAYDIEYAFSIDETNWSHWDTKDNIQQRIEELMIPEFYIKIRLHRRQTRPDNVDTIYQMRNVTESNFEIKLNSVTYDSVELNLKIENEDNSISQYPLWNFYNNQDITVKRWIDQCNAISEMYGHTCLYFKTVPVEVNATLQHTHTREVSAVKKIMIMFPNNEIGNPDKVIYSDWDMPLSDEFIAHIVWNKFKLAFGNCIPDEKDYIYLPMLNKMFRIGVVQPINKFMGKVAWFEVQLLKYEDDDSIKVSQKAYDELGNITEFEEIMSDLTKGNILSITGDPISQEDQHEGNIIDQCQELVDDSKRTSENITHDTVIEKRHATDNYQNKLVDSTKYISLKETERCRSMWYDRLEIVQVRPDSELFPVSMYDNSTVPNNTIGIQYTTSDFSQASKNDTTFKESFEMRFDFVMTSKFSGDIISLLSDDASILTISTERAIFPSIKLTSSISPNQESIVIQDIELNEIYSLEVKYTSNQYVIKLYKLVNKCKTLVSSDILPTTLGSMQITNINLFGGKFLSTNIYLSVDDKEIVSDTSQPIRMAKIN